MGKTMEFATNDVTVYLAAAGAGKTFALMGEMTELLKVYRPDEIAFVTFTRKGVANGIERVLRANPQLSAEELPYFRTLHALCFHALGLKHSSILNRQHLARFNKLFGYKLALRDSFDYQTNDDKLIARYDAERSGDKWWLSYMRDPYDMARYKRLVNAYESFKRENKLVDFYDCLLKFKEAGNPLPVKAAFIDEAQDLTILQWEVCRIAFAGCEKVRIGGDDYQAVFAYQGANPQVLIDLAKRYRTVKLEKSHRLPEKVYNFSKGITSLITNKVDKDFVPTKDISGFVSELGDHRMLVEAIQVDTSKNGFLPSRWYILFRNNCFIQRVADELDRRVIPYHSAGGFCIPDRELAKIKRFYNCRKSGFSTPDVIDRFCRDNNITDLNDDFINSDLIASERKYMFFNYVNKYGIDKLCDMAKAEPSILLSTTHKVKGGEADYVAVFLDCTKKVSRNTMNNIDDELRVLYVACTRARIGLYLIHKSSGYGVDKVIRVVRECALSA